ncbi:hypothetical protein KVV02_006506 [Mortierella alpina]|uniref:Exoribonuclease phosphorolytic domain-containing protein n=1 Tax=Mortierella alpina TaxID=64518 RepID=A0A9P8ACP0_MORAP|nr:hypothetical protein KVV02_006506 [Mortierella alpina]
MRSAVTIEQFVAAPFCSFPPSLRQTHATPTNTLNPMAMERKRVAGPELSVTPLIEFPVDHKRWTPEQEKRHDSKRQPEDMRPIYLKTGLIGQANGSAYIELEKTKLACGV